MKVNCSLMTTSGKAWERGRFNGLWHQVRGNFGGMRRGYSGDKKLLLWECVRNLLLSYGRDREVFYFLREGFRITGFCRRRQGGAFVSHFLLLWIEP